MVKRKIAGIIVDAEVSLRSRSAYPRTRSRTVTPSRPPVVVTSSSASPYSTSSIAERDQLVNHILKKAGIVEEIPPQSLRVETKAGWCLREGLKHIISVDDGMMVPLVEKHGAPLFYSCLESGKQHPCRHDDNNSHSSNHNNTATATATATTTTTTNNKEEATQHLKDPQNCFQSLCRIVAGQQLAGAAAQAIWKRLLKTVGNKLTPQSILDLVVVRYDSSSEDGGSPATKTTNRKKKHEDEPPASRPRPPSFVVDDVSLLQKPAGLSRSKAHSIVHLAHAFQKGSLSEAFLTRQTMSDNADDDGDKDLRDSLLQIKGIGPWSCDMFLMFYLERANILPLGDLGVRKGIGRYFAMKPSGSHKSSSSNGMLCAKKDADRIHQRLAPYHPYQSLLTYYMWKAADTKDFYNGDTKQVETPAITTRDQECTTSSSNIMGGAMGTSTPKKTKKAGRDDTNSNMSAPVVTP